MKPRNVIRDYEFSVIPWLWLQVRGHRIDCSEVGAALGATPMVRDAIVLCYRPGQIQQVGTFPPTKLICLDSTLKTFNYIYIEDFEHTLAYIEDFELYYKVELCFHIIVLLHGVVTLLY